MLNSISKRAVVFRKPTKELHSQSIIGNSSAEMVEGSSNGVDFGAIGFDIRKIFKFDIIKLDFKMKNAGGFIILKILHNAIPCILSIIIGMNNTFEKVNTYGSIKPSPNYIIKALPFGIGRGGWLRGVIGNDVIFNKMSMTMKFE